MRTGQTCPAGQEFVPSLRALPSGVSCVCQPAAAAAAAPRFHPKYPCYSLKHGLVDALKYILEWAGAVCTAITHLSVQSLADAIEYNWEWQQLFVLQSLIYLYSLFSL